MPERAFADLRGSFGFPRNHDQSQAAFLSVGKNRTPSVFACTQTGTLTMPQRAFVNFGFRGEIALDEDQRQTAGMVIHECDTCLVFHRKCLANGMSDKGRKTRARSATRGMPFFRTGISGVEYWIF